MSNPPLEKVRFKDGMFGVRKRMGDSYIFANVTYTGSVPEIYWYKYDTDIERYCHLSERNADYVLNYQIDLGEPI